MAGNIREGSRRSGVDCVVGDSGRRRVSKTGYQRGEVTLAHLSDRLQREIRYAIIAMRKPRSALTTPYVANTVPVRTVVYGALLRSASSPRVNEAAVTVLSNARW